MLDFSIRAAEKQRQRDEDARALATGLISAAALRRQTAVFREIAHEPIRWKKIRHG
jgi:hypothetical protein